MGAVPLLGELGLTQCGHKVNRFWATVCKTVRQNMLSDRCLFCLSVCPVCNVDVLWPKGWMYQDETRHGDRPRTRRDCVRWTPSFNLKRHSPANFNSCILWPNGADGSRCHLVRRFASPRRHCVRWPPSSPSKGGGAQQLPNFSAHVGLLWPNSWMDQDATW